MSASGSTLTKKERLSAAVCYLYFPFHVVPALVVWLNWKGESDFVCGHARNAINLYLTVIILFIAQSILWPTPDVIGAVCLAAVFWTVALVAAYHAWKGKRFGYPVFLRLIR